MNLLYRFFSFAEAEGGKKKNFKRNLQTCCAVGPTGIHGGEKQIHHAFIDPAQEKVSTA